MRAVPKFLLFRIPGSGYLGEVSIGSAKRSTFGKAPLVTALPYDIIGPVARKSPPTTHLNCRTPLFHSSFTPAHLPLFPPFPLFFLFPRRDYYLPLFNLLHHALSLDFLSFLPFAAIFFLFLSLPLSRSTLYTFPFFPFLRLLPIRSTPTPRQTTMQHSR